MSKEYRSPGVGEGGPSQLAARRSTRGRAWWALRALALVGLGLLTACSTGSPLGGTLAGGARPRWRVQRPSPGAEQSAVGARAGMAGTAEEGGAAEGPRHVTRRASEVNEKEHLEGEGVGWPDGVGDGRPLEVPMSLDYFQGLLVQAGVPSNAMPGDGRTLSPQQALELVPHLLSTPVTLGNFGLRRMAAHLRGAGSSGARPSRCCHSPVTGSSRYGWWRCPWVAPSPWRATR